MFEQSCPYDPFVRDKKGLSPLEGQDLLTQLMDCTHPHNDSGGGSEKRNPSHDSSPSLAWKSPLAPLYERGDLRASSPPSGSVSESVSGSRSGTMAFPESDTRSQRPANTGQRRSIPIPIPTPIPKNIPLLAHQLYKTLILKDFGWGALRR